MVPGALEEPLAAIFRVLRRPRNPSTVAGSPAARGRGRLPHVCCSKQANKARGGKRSAGGSAGQEPGGREARAARRGGHGATAERSTARVGQCRRRGGPTVPAPAPVNRVRQAEWTRTRPFECNGRTAGSSVYLGWKKEPEKEETKWEKKMREISKQKPLAALDHAGQLSSVER